MTDFNSVMETQPIHCHSNSISLTSFEVQHLLATINNLDSKEKRSKRKIVSKIVR